MNEKSATNAAFTKKLPALIAQFRIEVGMRKFRERLRILIVEDQLFSRRILQEILTADFTLDLSEDIHSGMRNFLKYAPDIILLDIELGNESGHKLATFIKSIEPDAFVVMVTGNHSAADVNEAKKNNVNGFIIKPYNKKKLYEFIDKYWELNPDRKPEETK